MSDMKEMTLGQIVDYVISYNNRQERSEKAAEREKKEGKRRRATQADINAFFG